MQKSLNLKSQFLARIFTICTIYKCFENGFLNMGFVWVVAVEMTDFTGALNVSRKPMAMYLINQNSYYQHQCTPADRSVIHIHFEKLWFSRGDEVLKLLVNSCIIVEGPFNQEMIQLLKEVVPIGAGSGESETCTVSHESVGVVNKIYSIWLVTLGFILEAIF